MTKGIRQSFAAAVACGVLSVAAASSLHAQAMVDNSLPQNGGIAPGTSRLFVPAPLGGVVGDNFNRADGPIGPNWTVVDGTFNVVSNRADGGSVARALFNGAASSSVEMDIAVNGNGLDYVALMLDYGAGNSNIFVKVQDNDGAGVFSHVGCYTGNNGSSFGLGFFQLSAPFTSAHMRVSVDATRTVTLSLTNLDGGAGSQTYTCAGAPAAEGTGIGVGSYVHGLMTFDNFSTGAAAEVQIIDVPTVSGYGLALLGLMLGLIGFVVVRRQS